MKCAWDMLLKILPQGMQKEVDPIGRERGQEIRMRLGKPAELRTDQGLLPLRCMVQESDLNFVINTASRYSPWAAAGMANGYITVAGGHRIGLCGEVCRDAGRGTRIRTVTSVNIRIARDFTGLIHKDPGGNILILGPPGSGKTTLLRDLCRLISRANTLCVVDEREEVFPCGFASGDHMDILRGCPKGEGIDMVLRTMGPECIAVDEITSLEDCQSVRAACWCGVRVIATAHARDRRDLMRRPVYRPLLESCAFEHLLILGPDKSWHMERMALAV